MRSMRRRRPLLCLALLAFLLIVQAGALLHASSHAADGRDGSGVPTQLCGQCLSFSTIFSMAGGPSALVIPLALAFALFAAALIAPLTGQPLARAFRSRAPPRSR
jgi:hypothetical protein